MDRLSICMTLLAYLPTTAMVREGRRKEGMRKEEGRNEEGGRNGRKG
jgi:hypothetical protein